MAEEERLDDAEAVVHELALELAAASDALRDYPLDGSSAEASRSA
jgi:hypothetical protein